MSGGSYDYLYTKEIDDLVNSSYRLREMADDLQAEWPQSKAARDTQTFLALLDIFVAVLAERKKPLEAVWRAQEWWKSMDSSRERVTQTIWDYEHPRGEAS